MGCEQFPKSSLVLFALSLSPAAKVLEESIVLSPAAKVLGKCDVQKGDPGGLRG